MPVASRDPNTLALLLQLAMQEQAPNPTNGQPRVVGRPQSALALNAYVDALPSAGEKDADFQRQRTADLQAQDEEQITRNKARLSDPYEAAKAAAEVRSFETRRNVAEPRTVKGVKAFTAENFPPVASHGNAAPVAPTATTPRTVKGVRTLTDKGGAFTDPDAAMSEKERALIQPSVLAAGMRSDAADSAVVKVEHKDPATGKTVIEYLPKSEVRGQTFEKGTNATTTNRLDSAEAVNQTGNDMIAKLSDPAYAKQVGIAMGRYNSLRDFVGNPPPEFAELAGTIESYSLANMGVHGMRSAQGAEQIKKLLDQKHTPESLIATIRGLNQFSNHFMENAGRPVQNGTSTTSPTGADPYADYLARQKK